MWHFRGFLSVCLMCAAVLMVVGQDMTTEEAECLSIRVPEDITDQEAVDSYLANCVVCGRIAATSATAGSCSALRNQCPVPTEDLLSDATMDTEADGNEMAAGGEVVLTTTDLVVEACANRTVDACKAQTIVTAKKGEIDVDCAKILVNGPDTSVKIFGCDSKESALDIYDEILDEICTATLPKDDP